MTRIIKSIFLLVCMLSVAVLNITDVKAAPQSNLVTLKLKVEVSDKQFWDCTFFTQTVDPSKPSVIKAEWSFGNMGKDTKSVIIVPNGKLTGEVSIVSEKGSLVNLDVFVKSAKNATLGYWGMQLINKGQSETVVITLPQELKPEFTRSNI